MSTNNIICKNIINKYDENKIIKWTYKKRSIIETINFISSTFNIDITSDKDIIKGFERDYSNISGNAEGLCRPTNEIDCAIILMCCSKVNISITISAGQTNLNGSATPQGGIVLSIEKMDSPDPKINISSKTIISPVGITLESLRMRALEQSNNELYYPVDPTSRNDAMVGGTVACNASGFIPGEQGATRYWTNGLSFLLPNGYKIECNRGDFISKNGEFILKYPNKSIILKIPTYPRPKIKNASGPYSDPSGKIDFIDLIVGSEGIFGLTTNVIFALKDKPKFFLDLFIILQSESDALKFYKYIRNYFSNDLSKITAFEYFGYNCQTYMNNRDKLFNNLSEVGIYIQIPLYNVTIEDVAEEWLNVITKSNCNIKNNDIKILNDPSQWKIYFNARHSIPSNALAKTKKLNTLSILTDTIVPSENIEEYLKLCHKSIRSSEIEYLLFGHLGDCHLHFHLIPTKDQESNAIKVYNRLVEFSFNLGGVYSAEHGTGKRKKTDFIKCFGSEGVDQIKKIKNVLDPMYLINSGNVINH